MERFGDAARQPVLHPQPQSQDRTARRLLPRRPDPDRGWALAALTDGLPLRLPLRRALAELMDARIDPVLFRLSRDYVGDTAETVALLWPEPQSGQTAPGLDAVVTAVRESPSADLARLIGGLLDRLDVRGRWALLKLLGGAPRVGVSARLAKTALAEAFAVEVGDIEEVRHALAAPYRDLPLARPGPAARPRRGPCSGPVMLAHPIEEGDRAGLDPRDFVAEWNGTASASRSPRTDPRSACSRAPATTSRRPSRRSAARS